MRRSVRRTLLVLGIVALVIAGVCAWSNVTYSRVEIELPPEPDRDGDVGISGGRVEMVQIFHDGGGIGMWIAAAVGTTLLILAVRRPRSSQAPPPRASA